MRRSLALVLFAVVADAKPRFVALAAELESASVVARVKVAGYHAGGLTLMPLDPSNAPPRADFPDWVDRGWVPRPLPSWTGEEMLTGEWPPVGAEVLIVLDVHGAISLFARLLDGEWRFFSPYMTGSTALFDCTGASPLKGNKLASSWDGCLAARKAVTLKVRPPRTRVEPPRAATPPPRPALPEQPRYVDWSAFKALEEVAGFPCAHPTLTREGMALWSKGELRVPPEGFYAQGDLDGDGRLEAVALVRDVRADRMRLIVASRNGAGWTRRGIIDASRSWVLTVRDGRVFVAPETFLELADGPLRLVGPAAR